MSLLKKAGLFGSVVIFMMVCLSSGTLVFSGEEVAGKEAEDFDFANGLFSRAMYDMAIGAYRDYMKEYPESRYTELAEYRISECYFLDGKYDDALDGFTRFSEKFPSGEQARKATLRRGQIFYLKGDYGQAKKILTTLASDENADDVIVPAKYYTASIYFKQGKYERSREILEKLLSEFKDDDYLPFAYMNLGDVYTELKKYNRAAEAYKEAALSGAEEKFIMQASLRAAGAYYQTGQYDQARSFYKDVTDSASVGSEFFDLAVLGLLSSLHEMGKDDSIIGFTGSLIPDVKSEIVKPQVLYILGNSFLNKDRFAEAKDIYAKTAREFPGTEFAIKSQLNVCWVLYKMGNYEECLSGVDAYIEENKLPGADSSYVAPDEARFLKAKTLLASGRTSDALKCFSGIIKEFNSSDYCKEAVYETALIFESSGKQTEAVQYYEMFVDRYKDDRRSPMLLLKSAQTNLQLKEYDSAEDGYTRFLSLYENDPLAENALYQLGMMYFEQNNFKKGIEVYKKFVKAFPDSEVVNSAIYWIGNGYQKTSEWDTAIKTYSALLSDPADAYYARSVEATAYCYFQKGDHERSAETYYSLMTEKSDVKLSSGVYKWLAEFYLDRKQNDRSLKVIGILTEKYPDNVSNGDILYMSGENHGQMGDWTAALGYYQKAIDANASSPYMERAYLGMGRAYLTLGDYEKAIQSLGVVLEQHTDDMTGALARIEIGDANFRMTKFDEAAKQYMMVAILYEDEGLCSMALFQAGVSFGRAGDKNKSLSAFKELIERYPGNALSKKAELEIERIKSETQ